MSKFNSKVKQSFSDSLSLTALRRASETSKEEVNKELVRHKYPELAAGYCKAIEPAGEILDELMGVIIKHTQKGHLNSACMSVVLTNFIGSLVYSSANPDSLLSGKPYEMPTYLITMATTIASLNRDAQKRMQAAIATDLLEGLLDKVDPDSAGSNRNQPIN